VRKTYRKVIGLEAYLIMTAAIRIAAAAAFAFAGMTGFAHAQSAIGGAETVERDVSGELPGRNRPVNQGDEVFAKEAIVTAPASSTNLRFLDETALAIGPRARVVLDRFVYNADRTARRSVVAAVRGALRWTSGQSRSGAYQIKTPLAAIGVRGTKFDLVVEDGQETVILREGGVNVCLSGTKNCKPLRNPGDVAYIIPGSISVAPRSAPSAEEFQQSCLTGSESGCRIDPVGQSIIQLAAVPSVPVLGLGGIRIGLTGSYSITKQDIRWSGTPGFQQSIGLGNVPGRQRSSDDRFDLAIDVGYDVPMGPVILGIEGDLSFNTLQCGTYALSSVPFGATGITVRTGVTATVKASSSLKARIGVPITDRITAYGIGGVSIGLTEEQFAINNTLASTGDLYRSTQNKVRLGYVVGAGAEVKITDFISAKFEYNHYDFGSATANIPAFARGNATPSGEVATVRTRISGDVFKTGLSLRF
jgi:opacity protein-like surface antigen